MINIDELRKIIADAPTFTHEINPDGTYRAGAINGDIRSLADIKTIIEQADTITSLRVMVKNLGAKAICKDGVEELTHELNNANRIIAEQADRITELEMRAKGQGILSGWMISADGKLRKQAGDL